MKKVFSAIILLLSVFLLNAETYKIKEVSYSLKGLTKASALSKKLDINTEYIFESEEEFTAYINDLTQRLRNERIFDEADVVPSFYGADRKGLILVDLLIKTTDSFNILGVPYPKYDSNSGITMRLKIKDYNFLGTMEPMGFTLSYKGKRDNEEEPLTHEFGAAINFTIPFTLFNKINSYWDNDFSFSYTIGDDSPEFSISEGFSFSIPLGFTQAKLGFTQGIVNDLDYKPYGDNLYFKENISLSFPLEVAKIPNFGSVTWTPSISSTYYWDPDVFAGDLHYGISHRDLYSPIYSFSHSLTTGRIDWIGNFRTGFSTSIVQSYSYNTWTNHLSPSLSISTEFHRNFTHLGFSSRQYIFINVDGSRSEMGGRIRGIRDSNLYTDTAIFFNFDMPIKLFQTDWCSLLNKMGITWNWPRTFDFEAQINPFIDIGTGNNREASLKYKTEGSSFFNMRDGWYGCGFEILGFPTKFHSIQGRLSLGVDAIQVAAKVADRNAKVKKIVDKFFNTDWRSGSWWELYFGIGLFY